MWNAIILLIRKAFLKNQLKKEERKSSTAELKKKVSKKIKKIKFKIFGINVSLTFVVISAIISFILFAMMLFALLSFMGAVSGNTILGWKEDEVQEEDPEKDWKFDNPNIYDPDTGELNISGGIYPKDPKLKQLAIILEIMQKTCDDANRNAGYKEILPSGLLSVVIRETGGDIINTVVDDTSLNIYGQLIYKNPICGKNSCTWIKNGQSHFVGATASASGDNGDPATQVPITDKSIYDRYYTSDGHALGYGQFEVIYLDGRLVGVYPIGDYANKTYNNSTDRFQMDSTLNFIRPNIAYIPDIIYNITYSLSGGFGGWSEATTAWNEMSQESWFKTLSDDEVAFCHECFKQMSYVGGYVDTDNMRLTAKVLKLYWAVSRDKGLSTMMDVMEWAGSNYSSVQDVAQTMYKNNKIYRPSNKPFTDAVNAMLSDTSIGSNTNTTRTEVISALKTAGGSNQFLYYSDTNGYKWRWAVPGAIGFESASYTVYKKMMGEIDAAEKEQVITGGINTGGRWIDYVGSGKFKPLPDNKYYSNAVMATIFTQASGSGTYREESWGTCRYYWGTDKNGNKVKRYMWYGGCGVYSTAFCITNLTGTLVTVEDIQNKGLIRSLPLPNDNVISIAKAYGLESYPMKIAKSDSQFENDVIKELKDGGMIVAVWHGAHLHGENKNNFPWYGGNAHFMVIRGYNNSNNKLRVYTSVNGVGCNQEQACNIELDAGTVRKYLSFNYTTCEVIKIPGGAGSITDSNSSSSSGGITSSQSGMIWPLSHDYLNLSSLYGSRIHPITGKPGNHGGIDIPAPSGTPIYAVKDGDVILTEYHKSWGNHVEVKHYDGTITNYAHMSKIGTTKGTQVKQGDVIGYVGTTGSSTGNHLHFEYWANGKYTQSFSDDRDPCNYYKDLPLKLWVNGKLVALW